MDVVAAATAIGKPAPFTSSPPATAGVVVRLAYPGTTGRGVGCPGRWRMRLGSGQDRVGGSSWAFAFASVLVGHFDVLFSRLGLRRLCLRTQERALESRTVRASSVVWRCHFTGEMPRCHAIRCCPRKRMYSLSLMCEALKNSTLRLSSAISARNRSPSVSLTLIAGRGTVGSVGAPTVAAPFGPRRGAEGFRWSRCTLQFDLVHDLFADVLRVGRRDGLRQFAPVRPVDPHSLAG
jgi:hypothetical protein